MKDAEKNSISTPEMAWLKFSTKAEIDEIKKIGDEVAIETDLLILIGMGGAVSGAKALLNALGYVGRKKGRPDIFIIENIDSESFVRLESRMKSMYQGRIDYSRTSVCAISQSGDTVETLTNLKTVWEMMSKDDSSENDLGKKTVIITNLKNGALLKVAKEKGCKTLRASDALMGLLGVFGNNGLFPLAVTGWNLERFIIGTKRGFQRSLTASLNEENYAFRLAESFYLLDTLKKKDLHGFFLYSDALKGVAEWLEQLWVEALAKSEIEGPRPLVMIGSTAQHSVNQDNIAGRNDKAILFVGVQSPRADYVMSGESVDYLRGNRMSELLEACREGTSNALTLRQRPNMTLVIPKIDEENLGEFFFTMAMTAHVLARLYGVDPYRQPAVENFKVKLRSRLQGEAY